MLTCIQCSSYTNFADKIISLTKICYRETAILLYCKREANVQMLIKVFGKSVVTGIRKRYPVLLNCSAMKTLYQKSIILQWMISWILSTCQFTYRKMWIFSIWRSMGLIWFRKSGVGSSTSGYSTCQSWLTWWWIYCKAKEQELEIWQLRCYITWQWLWSRYACQVQCWDWWQSVHCYFGAR